VNYLAQEMRAGTAGGSETQQQPGNAALLTGMDLMAAEAEEASAAATGSGKRKFVPSAAAAAAGMEEEAVSKMARNEEEIDI
jgi:hypothetical protein